MKKGDKFRIDWDKVLAPGAVRRNLLPEQLADLRRRHGDITLTALQADGHRAWFHYPDQQKGWVYTASLGFTRLAGHVKLMKNKQGAG
jgi:hypothetical protein